jgi:hypothetical protein
MSTQLDTLDPTQGPDDVSLDQFQWATINPHQIDAPDDPGETFHHSVQCAWHLAVAKSAVQDGNDVAVHQHLNRAMQHFLPLHAAAARASEFDPNRIRQEQED